MKTSELVTKVLLPIILTLISAAVGIYLSVERRPAKLVLERVFLNNGSKAMTEYGKWQLVELPKTVYERLRDTRPHPSRYTDESSGFLDKCFREETPWNNYIPSWHLCGNSYLLNTDSRTKFASEKLFRVGVLQSNSVEVTVYYPMWDFYRDVYENTDKYLELAKVSRQEITALLPYANKDQRRAKLYALTEKLDQKRIIPNTPIFRVVLRNTGGVDATLYEIRADRIFSRGGGAGGGGSPLLPAIDKFPVHITWETDTHNSLPSPVVLKPGDTTLLEFTLIVDDPAQGDGPGEILSKLSLNYFNGDKNLDLFLGNFLLSADVPNMFVP